MEVFVLKSLERLRSDSSRRDTEFREAADSVIRSIQENAAKPNRPPDDGDADKYFRPFQLACEIKTTKMRMNALDCIEKMISFGYLRGTLRVRQGTSDKFLVEIIVDAICACRDDKDEQVQLQIIKALNTAISSPTVKVIDTSLIAAIQACYHICLGSKNQVNKNTAKATLRQVLAAIFVRMEKSHEAIITTNGGTLPKPTPSANMMMSPSAPSNSTTTALPATPAAVAAVVEAPTAPAEDHTTTSTTTVVPVMLVPVKRIIKKTIRVRKEKPAAPAVVVVPVATPAPALVVAVVPSVPKTKTVTRTVATTKKTKVNPFAPFMYDSVAFTLGYIMVNGGATMEVEETTHEEVTEEVVVEEEAVEEQIVEPLPVVVVAQPEPEVVEVEEWEDVEVEEEIEEMVPAPVTSTVVVAPVTAAAPATPAKAAPPSTPSSSSSLVATPVAASAATAESPAVDSGAFLSQAHKDAYNVFKTICRLTQTGEEEPAAGGRVGGAGNNNNNNNPASAGMMLNDDVLLANPVTLQSKLLSMDLVLGLLEASGPAMRNGARFIAAIKQYLVVGLLKNFVSTIPALSALSLKTFMALMTHFKRHIAAEVEVFLSTVFLRMLASPASSHEQKMNVLAAFRSMCQDPASVLEMFLNYDCTEGRQNVFEDSVRVLASISQPRGDEHHSGSSSDKKAEETGAIRVASIGALSAVMKSIVVLADAAAKQQAESEGRANTILDGSANSEEAARAKQQERERREREADAADEEDSKEDTAGAADGSTSSTVAATSSVGSLGSPLASPAAGNSGSSSSSSNNSSSSAALARSYDEQKKRRALLAKAAVKFAVKPKKGIEYMVSVGLCLDTPASIAAIFHELRETLDKTAIGEYMGEEKAGNVACLHAYIDQLEFTNLSYDDGVRKFLSGFRLPGEAQKIDRMMEKFAQRFCECNPGVFPSADTAFILAYSIIMLHTDAHNPNIKPEKKMTKENFIRNNRGIANGSDLPSEFLAAIYDSIVARPFTLREDDALREKASAKAASNAGGAGSIDERNRRAAERADIVKQGQMAMTSARQANAARLLTAEAAGTGVDGDDDGSGGLRGLSYYSAQDVSLADHVRPMFDVAWGALLAVYSVNFETATDGPDDAWIVNTCLAGFNQAIHVAGCLHMEAERDMLVATLCKFTLLEPSSTLREFRAKHLGAQRALLSMAFNEGNYLGCAWGPVLVCVSSLARYINMSQGGMEDSAFFTAPPRQTAPPANARGLTSQERRDLENKAKAAEREREIERSNAALVGGNVLEADVTRLYTRSVALSSEAIADFVTQLTAVSLQELAGVVSAPPEIPPIGSRTTSGGGAGSGGYTPQHPRVHSLQKVVEVADFNMPVRPRMAWARIWDTLSRYFTAVCCSPNIGVAMYAIDSLRQLAMKFMEKPELKSFHFQTKFLYPFLAIMEATSPAAIAAAKSGAAAAAASGATGGAGAGGGGRALTVITPSPDVRELILHCCANIIQARFANIRSGWRSFMGVCAAAASDSNEILVSFAFSVAHQVLENHFEALVGSGAYVDAVKCMVAYGSNVHITFALRAIDHVATLGAHLARGRVPLEEDPGADFDGSKTPGPNTGSNATATSSSNNSNSNSNSNTTDTEWYDLDGRENADVVDDSRDKSMLAKLGGSAAADSGSSSSSSSSSSSANKTRGGAGRSSSNFDEEGGAAGGGGGGASSTNDDEEDEDAAAEGFAHENATDAAMLAADDKRGGYIRRFTDCRAHMRVWWPLLTGLGGLLTADPRIMVRMRVLHALFALLRRYGPAFSPELWSLIYSGVLLPLFDDVRHVSEESEDEAVSLAAAARPTSPISPSATNGSGGSSSSGVGEGRDMEGGDEAPHFSLAEFSSRAIPAPTVDPADALRENLWPARKKALAVHAVTVRAAVLLPGNNNNKKPGSAPSAPAQPDEHEWLRTTCMPALSSLVRLQSRFFTRLHFLLPALLRLIESCIDQEIEGLARIGVACLRLLLAEVGPRFSGSTWRLITSSLKRLFKACQPTPLLSSRKALLGDEEAEAAEEAAAIAALEAEAAAAKAKYEADLKAKQEADALALEEAMAAAYAIGAIVSTPFGKATITDVREELLADGSVSTTFFVVQLPFGVAYLQKSAVASTVAMPVPSPAPAPPAPIIRKPAAPRPAPGTGGLPFSTVRVVTQCVVQLELIGCVGVLADAHLDSLEQVHVDTLLALLQGSADFASKFNADRLLRKALWDAGFMRYAKHNKLPSLLRQETSATQQLLILLMRLYNHDAAVAAAAAAAAATSVSSVSSSSSATTEHKPWRELAIRHLVSLIQGILFRYSQLATDVERARVLVAPSYMQAALQYTATGGSNAVYTAERDSLLTSEHGRDLFREAAAFGPLVMQLLDGVLSWDDAQFRENLHWLYPLLTGLIGSGSVEIRQRLAEVFEVRLRKMLPMEVMVPSKGSIADEIPPSRG